MAIPAAAAAAYRAAAQIGHARPHRRPSRRPMCRAAISRTSCPGAIKDSIGTIRQGEQAATQQVQGKANLVDVVQSVNAAELTLDTVVAVRDKVVAAYQSIMNMPI